MRPIVLVFTAGAPIVAIRRLPGLGGNAETVGIGDVIKRATNAIGIQTCEGCARRAATLNRWFPFSNRPRREWLPLASGVVKSTPRNPLLRLFFGRGGLAYECTSDGSACLCRDVLDCLQMGNDGKCDGKAYICSEKHNVCIC